MNIFEAEAGENIYSAAQRVKNKTHQVFLPYATLVFNGISIPISHQSYVSDIAVIYNLKSRFRQLGEV